jgi:hypothetical protein
MADFPSPNSDQGPRAANSVIGRPEEPPKDMDAVPSDGANAIKDMQSDDGDTALFPSHQCETLENEWRTIQTNFVDSPQDAVKQADALVNKTIDTLARSFGDMRGSLERTWEKEGEVSTEELRLAMQNYRSFFRRLLSI